MPDRRRTTARRLVTAFAATLTWNAGARAADSADALAAAEAAFAAIPIFPTTAAADFYSSGKGRILVVNNRHGAAADTNPGTPDAPFRTIGAAARAAQPGDEVRVFPGVYRERVTPAQGGTPEKPVRYVAAVPGEVFVKGSDVWTPAWNRLEDGEETYAAELAPALFNDGRNPFLRRISIAPKDNHIPARPVKEQDAAWPLTLGQLFVGGVPYRQVERPELVRRFPETWIVAADGRSLLVHFRKGREPGSGTPVELTVRDRIFSPYRRGLGFIQVQGFVFEHCANQGSFPQGGAVSTRSGHHWRIEENVIRFAQTTGLDCGSETWDAATLEDTHPDDRRQARYPAGYHLIADNTFADNGLCGISGWHHRRTRVVRNVVERNNRLDFDFSRASWEEWAGIKFHDCDGAVIAGNLVRNNEGYGIWLDNRWTGVRVTRNVVLDNRMAGIFFELGKGPALVDTNIVAHTRPNGIYYDGMGIYAHDASGLTIAHNLILGNAGCGVTLRTTSTRAVDGQPARSSDERVLNNIIVENGGAAVNLPFPNALAERNVSDGNLLFGTREFWQGLGPWNGLMAVNKFISSAGNEQIVEALNASLRRADIPAGEWPNLNVWLKNPVLSLRQWQALTGNDTHSVEAAKGFSGHLLPQLPALDVKAGDDLWRVACTPVPEIETDFSGNAMPAKRPLPGPFQDLTKGARTLLLWPVPDLP